MNDPAPLTVANLKANKTWDEMSDWLSQVGNSNQARSFSGTIIVCPSSPHLAAAAHRVTSAHFPFKLGGQDVSRFEQGAYTGEFAASQIADLCQYVIIGHSERRQNFAEDDEILQKKVSLAKKAAIEPIFCVQNAQDQIPKDVAIVAYEPVFAIGTGNPDSPDNVKKIAAQIRQKGTPVVLYGGSLTPQNVHSFLETGGVDGILVGATGSLDPQKFIQILESVRG